MEEISKSITLFDEICDKIDKHKNTRKGIETVIGNHFDEYFNQLVFYPEPEYKRQAIVRRPEEALRISLLLIKKLGELNYIEYSKDLKELASDYLLKENRTDFTIASDTVKDLWKKHLGLEYPNPDIQLKFEEIFLEEFGYREHFLHQFQVFLIGAYIIDKLYVSRKTIIGKFLKSYGVPIETAWLAASTYHDFNYSTQKYNSWLKKYLKDVMRFAEPDVIDKLSRLNLDVAIVRENYLSTSEKLLSIIYEKSEKKSEPVKDKLGLFLYEKIVSDRNHGLLSGITLLKEYDKSKNERKKRISKQGIEKAALAIALHDEKIWEFFCGCKGYLLEEKDCDKKCKTNKECGRWDKDLTICELLDTIDFKEEPLIYLLILCDSAQDEGRAEKESIIIKSSLKNITVTQKGIITIILTTGDEKSHRIKHKEFHRVGQFLNDGKFKLVLQPEEQSFGKEERITL